MTAQRRSFTNDEKLLIIAQAQELGVARVLQEYNLSYSVYARWKLQLKASHATRHLEKMQARIDELEQENTRLKAIITNFLLQSESTKKENK
ncbi:transposase [Paraflavitalea pollutisoli]|uniref:transposase n=1 Tax=Paraflavitalea pollutisoli TaxID=3034143 RepID=UPI0023ED1889|nr:transposase [Paraflavitalea sp. H1-2-19X]